MKFLYKNVLFFIFFNGFFFNVFAMSKPSQTDASVILLNNRPCVYVVGSDGEDYTQGINLYDNTGMIWKNKTTPAAASKSNCVVIGDPNYVFKTNTIYSVEMGWGYADTTFCLMRDEMNHLYLSLVAIGGGSCTTELYQNSEDETRWQRLKDWWSRQ